MIDEKEIYRTGIYQYGYISVSEIPFGAEIRDICKNNVCRLYNTTWACPPAVGSVDQCKNKCKSYKCAMIFSSKYQLEDSFDFERMKIAHREFKEVCDKLYFLAKKNFSDFMILSNEGCIRCKQCTYPNRPCRKPEMLFPSLEGFGIYVNKAAEVANVNYSNGINTVTYFGMLLFN